MGLFFWSKLNFNRTLQDLFIEESKQTVNGQLILMHEYAYAEMVKKIARIFIGRACAFGCPVDK